ncbi:efflux RND transporter permease subunit [Pseudomonas sp. DTU_2021_1001937_2_SI_NGA_ILE_001]|uniref:efflux RND transporter permease subunit n=1 Tax=Pseudomonas sp. DTU_2021_1001937_2_SI_NGA_ILE_001 TaxID=3077589 RepID=UPI0028FC2F5D|nr:efflux RND transporter permease subunit [Pseudomonas sp. DTU_2021_1001937_2_SI_NGA_ILE_001]WNW14179.1 efflux RND transporter permease subunit [Pseudomonas sp. DTU_2021_1001937_2_SI_NGA_ILE_001]
MSITHLALSRSRLVLFLALAILLGGIKSFIGFPSQEEPDVTIRDALVSVALPGLPTDRVEALLARPLEDKLRELPELKTLATTLRPGQAIVQITARDEVADLPALWQRVRNKVAEVAPGLPEGTQGPQVDDDFGQVAVASIALTAPGFSLSELHEQAERLRRALYRLPGVQRIALYGLQQNQVALDFDPLILARLGLPPAEILRQLHNQNGLSSAGTLLRGPQSLSLSLSGEVRDPQTLHDLPVRLPDGTTLPLGALAKIGIQAQDPPQSTAFYRGQRALVLGISMNPGLNVEDFGKTLDSALSTQGERLPTGFSLHRVTFQADVVHHAMQRMQHVLMETMVIVMGVVMLFLGWRIGLIVGTIVPLTVLASLILMRALGIELQTVSIAALILALGLLVDNGIVIAEDIERRLRAGEPRRQACEAAGRTLAVPLLTSSLVIILAFSPFFLGQTSTNEYLRSLAVVLALTLLGSWALSLTVTPLLCLRLVRTPGHESSSAPSASTLHRGYARLLAVALRNRALYILTMLVLLGAASLKLLSLPYDFLPPSDRNQFQLPIQLEPGTHAQRSMQRMQALSDWLGKDPDISESIGYVAEGGPRIVLGLNPPLPGPEVAYFTITTRPGADLQQVMDRVRDHLLSEYPDVRAQPKRFSLGSTESGLAVYRISGPDDATLRQLGERMANLLAALPGTLDIQNDWGPRVLRYQVNIDQDRARRAGVDTQDIAQALRLANQGVSVTPLRDGQYSLEITARARPASAVQLADTPVYPSAGGAALPLSAVASLSLASEASVRVRRNQERAITVSGRNPGMTADSLMQALEPRLAELMLPSGYHLEMGGEIEDSAAANDALLRYLPLAVFAMLLLFVWQFDSWRKVLIIVASIPFILIGVALALWLSGYPFGFMATFGLLSLAGIIVNNAVLLLERIEVEAAAGQPLRQAIMQAALDRLRPIIMTKLTCILGLIPLMLFGGALWTGMAISMIGGLALGTLVTLGFIPVLYSLLYGADDDRHTTAPPG